MQDCQLRILLAEDEENDRLLFVDAISELKVKSLINTVNDGVELMDYLSTTIPMPQLIFLDISMPRKNGKECLQEIRSNEKYNEVLIAIFSTSSHAKDIEETLVYGANVYINKPNNFDKLKQALNKVTIAAFNYQNTFFNKSQFLIKI